VNGQSFAAEAYADHSLALHTLLLRVLECEECADHLVAHTFLVQPAQSGVQPTLSHLTRSALISACNAVNGFARVRLHARIRSWYLDVVSGSPQRAYTATYKR
jgi:hypothetical protein